MRVKPTYEVLQSPPSRLANLHKFGWVGFETTSHKLIASGFVIKLSNQNRFQNLF